MATYNIEMNTLNSSGSYDQLYPQTIMNNISDWKNNVYNKEEVDSNIQNMLLNNSPIKVEKFYDSTVVLNGTSTLITTISEQQFENCFLFIIKAKTPTGGGNVALNFTSSNTNQLLNINTKTNTDSDIDIFQFYPVLISVNNPIVDQTDSLYFTGNDLYRQKDMNIKNFELYGRIPMGYRQNFSFKIYLVYLNI